MDDKYLIVMLFLAILFGASRAAARSGGVVVVAAGTFGVLRLTLQSSGYRWRFVRAAGAAFSDRGSGTCH